MEDAIKCIKELVEEYKNVIPNANFIVELLEIVLHNSLTLTLFLPSPGDSRSPRRWLVSAGTVFDI